MPKQDAIKIAQDTLRECKWCFAKLLTHRSSFCTKECSDKYCNFNRWPPPVLLLNRCMNCEQRFTATGFRKYCSDDCRKNYDAKHPAGNCKGCGSHFFCREVSGKEYCSNCKRPVCEIDCQDCGITVEKRGGQTTRCVDCQKRKVNRAWIRARRKRQKNRQKGIEPIGVRQLWIRDHQTCQLCKKKIDWELKWPDRMSMSVDHIIPISFGGTDEAINVQASHLKCNLRKHATGGSQMRLFG